MKLPFIAFFTCVLLLYSQTILSQSKTVKENTQLWPQLFVNVKLTKHWSLHADGGYRTQTDLVKDKFQQLIRFGLVYQLNKTVQFSAGYAYFVTTRSTGINQPEHRPWQQISLVQSYGRLKLQHRYRLEQRFNQNISSTSLESGYKFNWRGRYQLQAVLPLNKSAVGPKTLFLQVQDEVFVNFGSAITYNYFDQNRFFTGFGYQFSKELSVITGYQHIYAQESSGYIFDNNHSLRISVYLNFDASKSDKTE